MRRSQSRGETEGESGSLFDRGRGGSEERTEADSESWFNRARAKYGLGALLVVAGVALFLFPEPITSTAGLVLIAVGALIGLVSWLR